VSSDLDVTEEQIRSGLTLLRVSGQLDVVSCPRLKEALMAVIDAGTVGIAVDLRDVTFIDSSGFTALLSATKRLTKRDGRLVLVSTDPSLARILRMMALTDVMSTFADPAEAIAVLDGLPTR
jgi:anti-sigma B factor antagonist